MSIKAIDAVWTHSEQNGTRLLVLLAIAGYAHDDGRGAYPALDTLAHKARLSDTMTRRILKELTECGELLMRPGEGPHGVTLYDIAPHVMAGKTGGPKGKTRPANGTGKGWKLKPAAAEGNTGFLPEGPTEETRVSQSEIRVSTTETRVSSEGNTGSPNPSSYPSSYPSLEMADADAPPSSSETSTLRPSKPKRSRKKAVAKNQVMSVPPPAAPAAPEQVAADAAAFDALQSASQVTPAPLDWSTWPSLHRERQAELMRRAIAEVCFGDSTSADPATWHAWDRPDVQPFHSEIRGHAKDLLAQHWDTPITALEVFQTFQRPALWGRKWMAWASGEYTRPTPGTVAKYVRSLHLVADAPPKFLAVLSVPIDPADAVRRAIEQNARIAPPPVPIEPATRRLSRRPADSQAVRGGL